MHDVSGRAPEPRRTCAQRPLAGRREGDGAGKWYRSRCGAKPRGEAAAGQPQKDRP